MSTATDVGGPLPAPVESPTAEELLHAYRVAVRSRSVEEHIVRLVSRGEVKFAIFGPGEEVHGTATALALSRVVDDVDHFGAVLHYRSGSLASMWCELHGVTDFSLRLLRQQFSKATDTMSGGRQMVYHLHLPEVGLLPVQSPVGMQLGKAAGYALGFKAKGVSDGLTLAVLGDGTTAEGDMHDAMNAASVWQLPVIILVTDNGVAISTKPEEGRGIQATSRRTPPAFGFAHYACDGRDFDDTFRTTLAAATYAKRTSSVRCSSTPTRFPGSTATAPPPTSPSTCQPGRSTRRLRRATWCPMGCSLEADATPCAVIDGTGTRLLLPPRPRSR